MKTTYGVGAQSLFKNSMMISKVRSALAMWAVGCLWMTTLASAAGPFSIGSRTTGLDRDNPIEEAVFQSASAAADGIEDTINGGFVSDAARQSFAETVAAAAVSNGSGLIVDRISDPNFYTVTAGVGANLYSGTGSSLGASANALPSLGLAAAGSVSVGVKASKLGIPKLGPLDGNRLLIYLNFMTLTSQASVASVSVFGLGMNLQYHLIPSGGSAWLAKWHGLWVTTGFNYTSDSVSVTSSLQQSSVNGTETMSVDLGYTVGFKSTNFYIPIEVSSGFSLLYLFNVYTGVAMDLNFGGSTLTGVVDGPVTATSTAVGLSSSDVFSGTAAMDLEEAGPSVSPSVTNVRTFVGAQVPLGPIKFAAEYTIHSTGAFGVTGMVRFAM